MFDVFPTLRNPRLAELYTPDRDLHLGVWSDEAVAAGRNTAQPTRT